MTDNARIKIGRALSVIMPRRALPIKAKNGRKYPIEADFVKERVKFSFTNSCGNFFSPISSINDTKK